MNAVGEELDLNTAEALTTNLLQNNAIDKSDAQLLLAAVGNGALRPAPASMRDVLRQAFSNIY